MSQQTPSETPPRGADNVLVFADTIGASQIISFLQPLYSRIVEGSTKLYFEPHNKARGTAKALIEKGNPSVVVLSRYTWAAGKILADKARKRKIPVIFHIDDDLLNVPESLGPEKFARYNDPKRLGSLRANIEATDLIYASTPALAQTLSEHGLTVPTISGDLYCTVDPYSVRVPNPSTVPTIGYMGTGGHSKDLALVLPAIESLMDELPSLRFETFGTIEPPSGMARFGYRFHHHEGVSNYVGFTEKLRSLGWWIGLAPLEDNPFNRCKADTKWVEYTFAGMATIAADLPVYQRACAGGSGILASSVGAWKEAMRTIILDSQARHGSIFKAQQKLCKVYTHAALGRQLDGVLNLAKEIAVRDRHPRGIC
jgi:glycosyltransferase involved in cell wall biosynthesis